MTNPTKNYADMTSAEVENEIFGEAESYEYVNITVEQANAIIDHPAYEDFPTYLKDWAWELLKFT